MHNFSDLDMLIDLESVFSFITALILHAVWFLIGQFVLNIVKP